MIFTPTAPDQNYDACRFVSETGVWEFGARRMIFGVRVCAGRVGEMTYVMDYCAGSSLGDLALLLKLGRTILEAQPETLTHDEMRALLPGWTRRPVVRDAAYMEGLIAQAARSLAGAP